MFQQISSLKSYKLRLSKSRNLGNCQNHFGNKSLVYLREIKYHIVQKGATTLSLTTFSITTKKRDTQHWPVPFCFVSSVAFFYVTPSVIMLNATLPSVVAPYRSRPSHKGGRSFQIMLEQVVECCSHRSGNVRRDLE
jgi:hypothetical protein